MTCVQLPNLKAPEYSILPKSLVNEATTLLATVTIPLYNIGTWPYNAFIYTTTRCWKDYSQTLRNYFRKKGEHRLLLNNGLLMIATNQLGQI